VAGTPGRGDRRPAVGVPVGAGVRALRIARGERPVGYKIGFTNRTIWPLYAVFVPVWGSMWNTTVAHCDGAGVVTLAHLCEPRIEPEAVFGFKATRPPPARACDDLFASLDCDRAPGFEIVQSALAGLGSSPPAQTVADGGHARAGAGAAPKVRIADSRAVPTNSIACWPGRGSS